MYPETEATKAKIDPMTINRGGNLGGGVGRLRGPVEQPGEIEGVIRRLEDFTSVLHEKLATLEKRLHPVLREIVQVPPENKDHRPSSGVALADVLIKLGDKVNAANDWLTSLSDRIAL